MSRSSNHRLNSGWGTRLTAIALLAALLVVATAAVATAAPADRATQLERRLGGDAQVDVHRETGAVRFVGSAPGRPLARPAGVAAGAAPSVVARAFLDGNGSFFGVRDVARELDLDRVLDGPRGGASVRFAQSHGDVPVLGGELIVNLDSQGRVLSSSGEVVPSRELASLGVDPAVSAAAAERAARAAVARAQGLDPSALDVASAELQVYDARLLGGPGLERPLLVWRTEVIGGAAGEIRELVLVDAQLGSVALRFDQVAEAKNRTVCDGNNVRGAGLPCVSPVLSEGGSTAGRPTDVVLAYTYAGDTYDFFFNRFGRDSLDGRGLPLRSTVRYCDPTRSCPYANAFWNGSQMAYGQGFAAADDVVGHELAHGVTDFASHLFYYQQSGSINESLSDVFGELIDLSNVGGTDTPTTRWQVGEDIPVIGALRDMENPPAFGDPDRMTSPLWDVDADEGDNGGVHHNSGINNKAAFLMTDGGFFNGQVVAGLGIDKVAQIYYTASTTMLTSASDYADLAAALNQACANLVGTAGIVAADCTQVAATVLAVEMAQQSPFAPAPDALICTPGDVNTDAFYDDFENTASGRWAGAAIRGVSEWYYADLDPYGLDTTYARSGIHNLWGWAQGTTSDIVMAMTGDVVVPAGGRMHFAHAFAFEDDAISWDGGVLEYSTNGGGSWNDASPLIAENGYNGRIAAGPLATRAGFVRESNGYISTRLDLSSLAGQSVRFRFRIGTDSTGDDLGWFIDDVRVYSCAPPPPPPPPAPPAPPTITPPSPRALLARMLLRGSRLTVRRGRVRLVLQCDSGGAGACRGTVQLGRRGSLGRARFRIADGRRAVVVIRLTRKARRALARGGRLSARLLVRSELPGGAGDSALRRTITIALPRR